MTNRKLYLIGASVELLILLVLLSSCMKEPEYTQDFGPEVSWDQISTAVGTIDKPTADTLKTHEFSYMESTQKIEDLDAAVVGQRSYEATARVEDSTSFLWTIVRQIGELVGGQMKISRWEDNVSTCKPGQDCTSNKTESVGPQSFGPLAAFSENGMGSTSVHAMDSSPRITYHNLQKTNAYIEVPPAVQARTNCGGLSADQCHRPLAVTKLSFDQVVWDGKYGNKVSVFFTFSKDIPFLATVLPYDTGLVPGVISRCLETDVTYQNQLVHLIQCDAIKDFTFGHD